MNNINLTVESDEPVIISLWASRRGKTTLAKTILRLVSQHPAALVYDWWRCGQQAAPIMRTVQPLQNPFEAFSRYRTIDINL